jgi:hypothetical protein
VKVAEYSTILEKRYSRYHTVRILVRAESLMCKDH